MYDIIHVSNLLYCAEIQVFELFIYLAGLKVTLVKALIVNFAYRHFYEKVSQQSARMFIAYEEIWIFKSKRIGVFICKKFEAYPLPLNRKWNHTAKSGFTQWAHILLIFITNGVFFNLCVIQSGIFLRPWPFMFYTFKGHNIYSCLIV